MARYNKNFELTLDDMDMIETALRIKMKTIGVAPEGQAPEGEAVKKINELLGRLHNQKTFYRPRSGAYIGG